MRIEINGISIICARRRSSDLLNSIAKHMMVQGQIRRFPHLRLALYSTSHQSCHKGPSDLVQAEKLYNIEL